jgi:hypothetical protein
MRKGMAAAVAAMICTLTQARLVVYGPQELKDKFEYTGKSFMLTSYRLQDTCLFC